MYRNLTTCLLLLLALFCEGTALSYCKQGIPNDSDENLYEIIVVDGHRIVYWEKTWERQDWEGIYLPLGGDCIPDIETAIKVSKAILENFRGDYYKDYVPNCVMYDKVHRIWFVGFIQDTDEGVYVIGGGVMVAIRQDNAEVIKIWIEE